MVFCRPNGGMGGFGGKKETTDQPSRPGRRERSGEWRGGEERRGDESDKAGTCTPTSTRTYSYMLTPAKARARPARTTHNRRQKKINLVGRWRHAIVLSRYLSGSALNSGWWRRLRKWGCTMGRMGRGGGSILGTKDTTVVGDGMGKRRGTLCPDVPWPTTHRRYCKLGTPRARTGPLVPYVYPVTVLPVPAPPCVGASEPVDHGRPRQKVGTLGESMDRYKRQYKSQYLGKRLCNPINRSILTYTMQPP